MSPLFPIGMFLIGVALGYLLRPRHETATEHEDAISNGALNHILLEEGKRRRMVPD